MSQEQLKKFREEIELKNSIKNKYKNYDEKYLNEQLNILKNKTDYESKVTTAILEELLEKLKNDIEKRNCWNIDEKYLTNDKVNLKQNYSYNKNNYDYEIYNEYDDEKYSYEMDCRDEDVESFIEYFM